MDRDGYTGPRFVPMDYVVNPTGLAQREARVINGALESYRENLLDTRKCLPSDSSEHRECQWEIEVIDKVLDE